MEIYEIKLVAAKKLVEIPSSIFDPTIELQNTAT